MNVNQIIAEGHYSFMATPILTVTCTLLLALSFLTSSLVQSDTYIVHMNLSAMPNVFSDHHNWFLATVSALSDNTNATISTTSKLLYPYLSSVHGFSATLTNSELEVLKKSPAYISSTRDHPLKIHTTYTPQFLGLTSVSGSWQAPNNGEDVIIGLVDTGIWPESESFNDDGMSEIPSRWKGKCVSGVQFSSSSCNKKLIGAQFFSKGILANNPKLKLKLNSPRDSSGHGTHTSSTAAGRVVTGASYFGYANGTARGIASGARIAMYKAVWRYGVYASDALAAIDQAIQDGVDILSLSLGLSVDDIYLEDDTIAVATFAAMQKGIFVAASAGNDGPLFGTVINGAPWLVTVAAGTIDRELGGFLILGNGKHISFPSLYPGNTLPSQMPIVFLDGCLDVQEMKKMRNKIIVCKDNLSLSTQVENAESAGVSGAVFITDFAVSEFYTRSSFPAAYISLTDGETVIHYVKTSNDPRGTLEFHKTVISIKAAPKVDSYSSRGPFPSCPNVLKPDILAPGTLVLASWSPISSVAEVQSKPMFSKFNLISGTSMATPHVAGVAALIKKAHPDWSPAAIRSALVTTANSLDNTLSPIKDTSNHDLPATPLDMGAGRINPIKSLEPGIVYDATSEDYVKLLCAMKYTQKQLQIITKSTHSCVNKSLDLNYPSFIAYFISNDNSNSTRRFLFERTVTNVGDGVSIYTAKITGMEGLKVSVVPGKLIFKEKYEKLNYKLVLEGPKQLKEDVVHGYLSWVHSGGKYEVKSPIVATTITPDSL